MSSEEKTQFLEAEVAEERVYTVPLGEVKRAPRDKRANKAVRLLRNFAVRHMKTEDVIIDPKVNEKIWERGIQKPPNKLKVRLVKSRDGVVEVLLAEE